MKFICEITASGDHLFDSLDGFQCPDENSVGGTFGVCHDIEHVVHAVAEVNVGITPAAEHNRISGGLSSAEGMATPLLPRIRFRFHDQAACYPAIYPGKKGLSEEFSRYFNDVGPLIKAFRQLHTFLISGVTGIVNFGHLKIKTTKFSTTMKKFLFITALALVGLVAEAQVQTPAASPAGSVSTTVGLTDVKIDYFRPRAKGRKIFGTEATVLVPYGKIWRTGANSGTRISFSDDVKVEGIAVPKGEYLLLTWPGATEWTVSLYKDVALGGSTGDYDASKDAANFKVKSEKLTEKVETLTFNIGDISDDSKSAKVQIAWENTSVKFTIVADYEAKVMKSIEANTKVSPNNYFQAAVFYLENGKDLKQALEWVNKAAEGMNSPFWVLHQKAKIQKGLGDKAGALATATASLESAKKANNRDYQMMNEDLIKSLK